MYHIIYKTTHIPTGMYYIGKHHQTVNNPYLFDGYYGSGSILKQILKKNKEEYKNLKRETLFWFLSEEEAYAKEAELVDDNLLKDPKCMNLVKGGPGGIFSGSGKSHRYFGMKWMHNTELNVAIRAKEEEFDMYLSKGFVFGRPKSLHKKVSQAMKGLIWIHKDEISKQIYDYELPGFLNEGWIRGRTKSFSNSIHISELNKNKSRCMYKVLPNGEYDMTRVATNEIENYLNEGYIFGSPLSGTGTKNRIAISNPDTLCTKYIDKDKLEEWLNKGWVRGNLKNIGHIPWNKGLKGTKKKKLTHK